MSKEVIKGCSDKDVPPPALCKADRNAAALRQNSHVR